MSYTETMQKTRKLQPLTKKQEAFFEEVSKGVVPYEAAKKVYNCKNDAVARVIASKNSKHPVIYNTVRELMESKGSRAKSKNILKAIEDGLVAEKSIETESRQLVQVPNHAIRLKAAELALKVRGELKQDLPEIDVNRDIRVTFNLVKARSPEEVRELMPEDLYKRRPIIEG